MTKVYCLFKATGKSATQYTSRITLRATAIYRSQEGTAGLREGKYVGGQSTLSSIHGAVFLRYFNQDVRAQHPVCLQPSLTNFMQCISADIYGKMRFLYRVHLASLFHLERVSVASKKLDEGLFSVQTKEVLYSLSIALQIAVYLYCSSPLLGRLFRCLRRSLLPYYIWHKRLQ